MPPVANDPDVTLVLGGARSGKSAFAQRLAAASEGPVLFVATGVVWGPINLIRLRTARQKGKELASAPVTPGPDPASVQIAPPPPVAKRRA